MRRALLILAFAATPLTGTFAAELGSALEAALESAGPDERLPILLVMRRQLASTEIDDLADRMPERRARRAVLARRLRQEATAGQADLRAMLVRAESEGFAARVRSLWITSAIAAEASPDLIRVLARRGDVARIRLDARLAGDSERSLASTDGDALEGLEIECGSTSMRATEVRQQLDLIGRGALVAVIDSGVCWSHGDIRDRVWVNPGEDLDGDGEPMDADDLNSIDDDGNGYVDDLIGWDFTDDDNDPDEEGAGNHGSHVAGTVAGDGSGGFLAGVAPGARVMPIRGAGGVLESSVWESMQYAAENGADAMNLSLGYFHSTDPDRAGWRDVVDNVVALGTTVVTISGNEGRGMEPNNVRTPGDVPRAITVGAVDCSDVLAPFSSVGPVTWQDVPEYGDHPYPPGLLKPDVVAPGVLTRSHERCDGYAEISGTSMAAPHVAGAVALMLEADPSLEHDEIKQLLIDTAVDLGDPGPDNDFGWGRTDAYQAVTAAAARLVYESHLLDDGSPNYGNGDGELDLSETVTLRVTLRNRGAEPATGVRATLETDEPQVEILDAVASFGTIGPGATAEGAAPHFTLRVPEACGLRIGLRLRIEHDEGVSHSGFRERSGRAESTTFFEDDMEQDLGWTVSGTEIQNNFVREDPHESRLGATIIQPEDDQTATGTRCQVTGNPPGGGGRNGDLDAVAILTSPALDLTGADRVRIELARWVYVEFESVFNDTSVAIQGSNDDGGSWTEFERVTSGSGGWEIVSIPLMIEPSDRVRLRVRAAGESDFGDSAVEALVDDVIVHGDRYVCDSFEPPPAQPPNAVGATLTLSRDRGDVNLEWTAPLVDASHDAATFYDVHTSTTPGGGFAVTHVTTAPFWYELAAPPSVDRYYVIVARNAGGTSGEEPAP